jgi:glycerol-3-phosphate acyltransferase PlsX
VTVTIALDAMGGDHAPQMVVEGAAQAAATFPDAQFVLVGMPEMIQAELVRVGVADGRFSVQAASEVVSMDEKPAVALRTKRDSSIRVGANLVKSGAADAFVSAGNTGALMATAKYVLKTLPEIGRPAIASLIPTMTGSTLMLDLGANVDCSAAHLTQFAMMGKAYMTTVMDVPNPRVALLNIGEEEMKGNEVVRDAGEILKRSIPGFMGNIEGTDIFKGGADVVVCDGFVGNVSLKTMEGVAQLFRHFLKEAFTRSVFARVSYLMARPALQRFGARVDHRRYNGAMLLGLNGIVVKSHGSADAFAFSQAIQVAVELAANRVNDRIRVEVSNLRQITNGGAS